MPGLSIFEAPEGKAGDKSKYEVLDPGSREIERMIIPSSLLFPPPLSFFFNGFLLT